MTGGWGVRDGEGTLGVLGQGGDWMVGFGGSDGGRGGSLGGLGRAGGGGGGCCWTTMCVVRMMS